MTTYALGGTDWVAVQAAMQNYVVEGTGLPADKVRWMQQDSAPRAAAPAVELRISNIAESGRMWIDYEDNILTFSDIIVSADHTTNTLTATAHGRSNGDGPIQLLTTGTVPTGLALATDYWLIVVDANHLQIADSYIHAGGASSIDGAPTSNTKTPLTFSDNGTGALSVHATDKTVPAGQETAAIARGYLNVTLELHCHAVDGVGMNMATSLLQRVRARRVWPSMRAILAAARVAVGSVERVRAILGAKDAVLFEPRAYMDIHFCVVVEEAEFATIIEHVRGILNQTTGESFDVDED